MTSILTKIFMMTQKVLYIHITALFHYLTKIFMLTQMVLYIHITLLLLDPHDIHHEGKKFINVRFFGGIIISASTKLHIINARNYCMCIPYM